MALLCKNLLTEFYDPSLIAPLTACRLIPLSKGPSGGIRPIGVGEVLRRIMGKVVASTLKEQIKEAAGPLQTCASHGAGAEAAIHSMREIFEKEETDGVLPIDASNTFNNMNRAAALHNIQIQCPSLSKYIINQYRKELRLFITGGAEIQSQEGTTQGDPLAMAWYSIATSLLITILRRLIEKILQAWLADDAAAAGDLESLLFFFFFFFFFLVNKVFYFYHYKVLNSESDVRAKSATLEEQIQSARLRSMIVNEKSRARVAFGRAKNGSISNSKDFCNARAQFQIKSDNKLVHINKMSIR